MKKTFYTLSTAICLACSAMTANAGNPLDALGGIVSSFTSTTNFEISDIVGEWQYQSPAVSFKSGDAFSKIGGVAASTALEDKLATYYNAAGLNTMELTVNPDDSFSMKIRGISLSGTIAKDGDNGMLSFSFSAFGKVNIGTVSAMAEKSALNTLTLTFDASGVINIIEKVADFAKIQSLQTLSSLLSNYEGLYAGARLKKTGSAPASSPATDSSAEPAEGSSSAAGALDAIKGLLGK